VAGGWKDNALKEARVGAARDNVTTIPPGEDSTGGGRSSAHRSREEQRHEVAHVTEAVGILPHSNLMKRGKIVRAVGNNEMDGGGGGTRGDNDKNVFFLNGPNIYSELSDMLI
jgi:hypothetical protein